MISAEPKIKVGICEGYDRIRIRLNGDFDVEGLPVSGLLSLAAEDGKISAVDESGKKILQKGNIFCRPRSEATFTIYDVTIGVKFHWEREQEETFGGNLDFIASDVNKITAVNEIGLEDYLVSVISSEMSAAAPLEFLKAHAVTSRSWLGAMLGKGKKSLPLKHVLLQTGENIRWYDREDHSYFDVCADDHCQRYQGIPKNLGGRAEEAVQDTRGLFLVSDNEICDARYHKACGGITDDFATAWEDKKVPYLSSLSDSSYNHPPLRTEAEARNWILSSPEAYCHALDGEILKQILPAFDQETADFFRWQVEYSRTELEGIIEEKTGADLGVLYGLVPLTRGPSGRISRLQIVGSKSSLIVGKELEIRRMLSRNHLLSSAFAVFVEREASGIPVRFILKGAGWGHGVGLCQIGAAAMATRGFKGEEILLHYFHGAALRKLY